MADEEEVPTEEPVTQGQVSDGCLIGITVNDRLCIEKVKGSKCQIDLDLSDMSLGSAKRINMVLSAMIRNAS